MDRLKGPPRHATCRGSWPGKILLSAKLATPAAAPVGVGLRSCPLLKAARGPKAIQRRGFARLSADTWRLALARGGERSAQTAKCPPHATVARLMDRFSNFESKQQAARPAEWRCCRRDRRDRAAKQGQAESLLDKRRHGALRFRRVTAKHRRPHETLRQTPLVVPYFSQNDNASGTGYASASPRSCGHARRLLGARFSSDDATKASIRAQVRRQHRGPGANLHTSLRFSPRAGGQTFSQWLTADLIKKKISNGRPAVAPAWLHKGPSSAHRAAATLDSVVTRLRKRAAGCHNDPNGEAKSSSGVGTPATSTARASTDSAKNWDPRWKGPGGSGRAVPGCKG